MADSILAEARRLAKLPARERKATLELHRRIADDDRLSVATRNAARNVADALERHLRRLLAGKGKKM